MRTLRWVLVVVVLAAMGVAGVVVYQRLQAPTVTVTEAVQGPVVHAFYATGTLLPHREYQIRSPLEGIVTEVWVDRGQSVNKGQPLAFVHVGDYQMQYRQADANLVLATRLTEEGSSPVLAEFDAKLKAAQEQLQVAREEFVRVSNLRSQNAASQSDFDRASERLQTTWSLAESLKAQRASRLLELRRDVEVARAALDIAQWNLDQQTLRSPVQGIVLDRPVSLGTQVRVNDLLLTVADVSPAALVMRASVDEEDKTQVQEGQTVRLTLYAYPGQVFTGQVTRVYPMADPVRRTFEVDVEVKPVDPRFAAGMTGELAFIIEQKEASVVVPSQAVQNSRVFVVNGESRVQSVEVVTGLRSIERTEIASGLRRGDRVVISPLASLADGQLVRTRFMDPGQAAGINTPTQEKAVKGFPH